MSSVEATSMSGVPDFEIHWENHLTEFSESLGKMLGPVAREKWNTITKDIWRFSGMLASVSECNSLFTRRDLQSSLRDVIIKAFVLLAYRNICKINSIRVEGDELVVVNLEKLCDCCHAPTRFAINLYEAYLVFPCKKCSDKAIAKIKKEDSISEKRKLMELGRQAKDMEILKEIANEP